MSYEILPDEPLGPAVRRVAREEVRLALEALGAPGEDAGDRIHEARKGLKRIRAVLRLVRGHLGEESFRAANVPFRDAGRLLASARDADVARETVDRLRELDGGTSAELALVGLRERLAARGRSVLARAVAAGGSVGEAKEQIRRAGEDVDGWPVDDLDFPGVRAGFLEVYGRGRREMAEALRRPEGPLFHEWRKRVKYFWYHTRLVTPCWPGVGSSTEPQQDLSDLLGDANDLSDLLRLLDEDDDRGLGSPAAREVVRILAVRRRGELWARARSLGRSLYAEAPDALGARMDEEWRGMRLEGRRG